MKNLEKILKKKNYLIIGAVNVGRLECLAEFFLKLKVKNLYIIGYDGVFSKKKKSYFRHYANGILVKNINLPSFTIPYVNRVKYPLISITFFYYLLSSFYSRIYIQEKVDFSISVGTFFTLCNYLINKTFFYKSKIVYYSIDYYFNQPNYFKDFLFFQKLFIKLNHLADLFMIKISNYYWELNKNISKARKKVFPNFICDKKIYQVPIGYSYTFHKKYNLITNKLKKRLTYFYFATIGVVTKNQGLDLILNTIRKYEKKLSKIKIIVIGSGPYLDEFIKKVKKNDMQKYFIFTGFVSFNKMSNLLSNVRAGLTLFPDMELNNNNHSLNSEPGKIKLFYSLNTPVIITKNISISKIIKNSSCGLTINYNEDDLLRSINLLKNNNNYSRIFKKVNWFKINYCNLDLYLIKTFKKILIN